ncbi:MarR family winged helix-turn-helix transcriptional regulator [Pedobacter sp. SYSU D00535]|uniref:MarR family winged helix-turn-helix transcriptional regulator n=1 Tax=Pedobacter sp. SYSU D00535 TaxID=2810308 RepID=UPI001A978A1E|nr:MarR family transcriptional regulator [Pedobacter sp. SYSU D00535]
MSNRNISLGFLVGFTRRLILKKMNEALSENQIPLTLEQFLFLATIKDNEGDLTQQDLANLTCKDKSAILRTIDILESKGLVERKLDTTDRRKNFIVMTENCRRLFDRIQEIEKSTFDQLRQDISEDDYQVMEKVLLQIQKNASK